jgi:hypothetical protein
VTDGQKGGQRMKTFGRFVGAVVGTAAIAIVTLVSSVKLAEKVEDTYAGRDKNRKETEDTEEKNEQE